MRLRCATYNTSWQVIGCCAIFRFCLFKRVMSKCRQMIGKIKKRAQFFPSVVSLYGLCFTQVFTRYDAARLCNTSLFVAIKLGCFRLTCLSFTMKRTQHSINDNWPKCKSKWGKFYYLSIHDFIKVQIILLFLSPKWTARDTHTHTQTTVWQDGYS